MRLLPLFVALAISAHGADLSGSRVTGRVVVDGKIPKLRQKASSYNPYGDLQKESPAQGPVPIRHLLVYLEGGPALHYKPKSTPPQLRQKNKDFVDDIVPVIKGGEVEILNNDKVYHHIRSSTKPWAFNMKKKAPGESATQSFEALGGKGAGVVPVYCDIHSKMRAHIIVLDNPFYELLAETGGTFSIKNVPPGIYTLTAFHPTLKVEPVKITVGKGRFKPVTLHMIGEK